MRRLSIVVSVAILAAGATAAASTVDPSAASAETLSVEKKRALNEQYLAQMRAALKKAAQMEDEAKASGDILQMTCISDKVDSVEGLLKIAEQSDQSFSEAVQRKDDELVNHEFTKMSIAATRIEALSVEVEGCVGEASQYTGQTTVDTQIDESLRTDDPAESPITSGFVSIFAFRPAGVIRPPAVSGSR